MLFRSLALSTQVLTPREQDILHDRFYLGMDYRELGDKHHVSVERIRQLERKSIRKLRQALEPKESL